MKDCQICNLDPMSIFAETEFSKASCGDLTIKSGHIIVATKRHKPDISDLTPEEASDLMMLMQRIAQALGQTLSYDKLYIIAVGDVMPHFHFHLLPRKQDESPLGPVIFGPEGWRKQLDGVIAKKTEAEIREKLAALLQGS